MSEFKVPLTKILDIQNHPNADRLSIATVYGFQIVIPKDRYLVQDTVLLCPIDSVLPVDLEEFLIPKDAKIKLTKGRIKQIRIRNFPSQGMVISIDDLMKFTGISVLPPVETDMASVLKINKYEPPAPSYQGSKSGLQTRGPKPLENQAFHKFNGLESVKWYPNTFQEGEEVVLQEKIHGSSIRAAILPTVIASFNDVKIVLKTIKQSNQKLATVRTALNMVKKIIKGKLGLLPPFENCYGSNNVELTNRVGFDGFYGSDIYGAVLSKINAFNKIQPNEIIYGELYGSNIQKNYDYGLKDSHGFILFDVKRLDVGGHYSWLSPDQVEQYAKERGFDFVPILYKGPYNKELTYSLTKGDSVLCPAQKVREGLVIKSKDNYNDPSMPSKKRALKWVSEVYLDKDQSDFH